MSEKVNAPEISVKNVSMVFSDSKGNPVQALKNVSIDIQKGEFISLLGPSGCGKSTLLRIVSDFAHPHLRRGYGLRQDTERNKT